ncbi:MAG: helix-turn-helix domain-containing protein [Candidatus Thiodiazotropha taylori]|nr:helix-turn-helix domain-containing protein [Candidatus Thiodiazotropha taylori]
MDTERSLIDRYGPLLTLSDVAEILRRSPDGLRVSLTRKNDVSDKLNTAKKKIGRRVYFRVSAVAELIDS